MTDDDVSDPKFGLSTEANRLTVLEGIATTRSIHRYLPDPVTDDDLRSILFAATRAPSGSNAQPFRFIVLRNGPKALKAKSLLGGAYRKGWESKSNAEGWQEGSGADPNSRKARSVNAMLQFVERFEEIPVVILACCLHHRPPHIYDGASVYPACQNILLAARALGYGACISMWHPLVETELRELLEIPEKASVMATLTLGKPEGGHGPLRRRPLADLVFDDGWKQTASWIDDPPGCRFSRGGRPSAER